MTGALKLWWRGLGWLRWPSALLVALALALTVVYQPIPLGWTDHGERVLGNHVVRLHTKGRVRAGREVEFRLEASDAAARSCGICSRPSQPLAVHEPLF